MPTLPPIHDAVRFWYPSEAATLQACVAFRGRQPPRWNLHWLRDWAPRIITGQLNARVLRQAVEANVPEEAQRSVTKATELLLKFAAKHSWRGRTLAEKKIVCSGGFEISVKSIGVYESTSLGKKFVIGLQPRAEDVPNIEQYRMWHSALFHHFAATITPSAEVMIVDLAKNPVNGNRELRELTARKLPLLSVETVKDRLSFVAALFEKAGEISSRSEFTAKKRSKQGELPL